MPLPTRNTPAYARKRPAPRNASGWGKPVTDTIVWTRILDPRERYRITYQDREGQRTDRIVELSKIGISEGHPYLGVMHEGRFKTMRADRVVRVLEQLTTGHEPSIAAYPIYDDSLPAFPLPDAIYKMPTIAAGTRTWTVDLNRYTCTCPEKRPRAGKGFQPGQLGFVCPHIARAILDYLPIDATGWSEQLRAWLGNPRNTHVDNLTRATKTD